MNYVRQFQKMFWRYFFIITLPILIVGVLTVTYFFTRLAYDTERLNLMSMQHTGKVLDASLVSAVQVSLRLRLSNAIMQIAEASHAGKMIVGNDVYMVKKEISRYKASDMTEGVGVWLPRSDILIESDAYYSFNEYYNSFLLDSGHSIEWWMERLGTAGNRVLFMGSEANGKRFIIYCTALKIPPEDGSAVIVMRINVDSVLPAYQEKNQAFAILGFEGDTILKTANFDESLIESGGNGKTVFFVKSATLRLKYVFKFLKGNVKGNAYVFAIGFVALLCLGLLVSGFLARISVRNMQKPLAKLHGENEKMLKALDEQIENARNIVLTGYLYGEKTAEKWAEQLVTLHGFGFSGEQLRVAVISGANNSMIDYWANKDMEYDAISKTAGIFKNHLFGVTAGVRCIKVMGTLVLVMDYNGNPNFYNIFECAINEAFLKTELELNVGIGLEIDDFDDIIRSYEAAISALSYGVNEQSGIAVYDDAYLEKEKSSAKNGKEQLSALVWCVKNGTAEKLEELLNKIYAENFVDYRLTPASLKKFTVKLICVLYDIIDVAFSDEPEKQEKFEMTCRNVLRDNDPHECFSIIKKMYHSLCKIFLSRDEGDKFRDNIVGYINENYMNLELSLSSMATLMDMSYSYFSRLFKEKMGSSFSAYLMMIRMERSKGLLESTEMTVKQIAEKVGFSDSNTFIRAYKKYYKTTPNKHRGNPI